MANKLTTWVTPKIPFQERPDIDPDQKMVAAEFQELYENFNELVDEVSPVIRATITNPLTFNENISEDVTINVNTTLELGSGDTTKDVFSLIAYRIATGNTITFGTSFPAELLADTSFINSFEENKTNTVAYVWKGGALRRWSNQVTEFGTPAPTTPEIDSAIVTDANPDHEQITFNVTPTAGTMTGFTHNGGISDVTIISIISQVANVWTVQLSRSLVNGETGSLVWASSDIENSGQFLADSSEVVDNQVGGVVANPVYVSSEIGNVDNQTLTFSVDTASNYDILGITLDASGGPLNIVANTAGDGTITGNYSLNRAITAGETVDITVAVTNGIVNIVDGVTMMTAITSEEVTINNYIDSLNTILDLNAFKSSSIINVLPSTPATDGQDVVRWIDQSSNGLFLDTETNSPTLNTANSHVDFNTDKALTVTPSFAAETLTQFTVAGNITSFDSTGTSQVVWAHRSTFTGIYIQIYLLNQELGIQLNDSDSVSTLFTKTITSDRQLKFLIEVDTIANSHNIYIDTLVSPVNDTTDFTGNFVADRETVGGFYANPQVRRYNGAINRLSLIPELFNNTEKQNILDAL